MLRRCSIIRAINCLAAAVTQWRTLILTLNLRKFKSAAFSNQVIKYIKSLKRSYSFKNLQLGEIAIQLCMSMFHKYWQKHCFSNLNLHSGFTTYVYNCGRIYLTIKHVEDQLFWQISLASIQPITIYLKFCISIIR